MSVRLPDFPWDTLAPVAARAREHADGIVDLSVGTPVDPTPDVIQEALRAAANAPGYPTTIGIPELGDACRGWLGRSLGVTSEIGVLPTIGSKEMVAWLPTGLGVGVSDTVVIPQVAYPTYSVGAIVAGAEVVATDDVESVESPALVWLNSPSNPTGAVLDVERLSAIVSWARDRNVVVVNDECYIELGWEETPVSILDPRVNGGDVTNLLAVHSLSKRSSMAGYRFGFLAGDPAVVSRLLGVRKHLGMMVPGPVQRAAVAAYNDDQHVTDQRARYSRRRSALKAALESAGFSIDHSVAGLYLWTTRGQDSWATAEWFAERGILVAPGAFYGDETHVRVALTATDERVDAAVSRLSE
jgi:succinyldiaminopimelate transaminase